MTPTESIRVMIHDDENTDKYNNWIKHDGMTACSHSSLWLKKGVTEGFSATAVPESSIKAATSVLDAFSLCCVFCWQDFKSFGFA